MAVAYYEVCTLNVAIGHIASPLQIRFVYKRLVRKMYKYSCCTAPLEPPKLGIRPVCLIAHPESQLFEVDLLGTIQRETGAEPTMTWGWPPSRPVMQRTSILWEAHSSILVIYTPLRCSWWLSFSNHSSSQQRVICVLDFTAWGKDDAESGVIYDEVYSSGLRMDPYRILRNFPAILEAIHVTVLQFFSENNFCWWRPGRIFQEYLMIFQDRHIWS